MRWTREEAARASATTGRAVRLPGRLALLALAALLAAPGCGTTTKLSTVWRAPAVPDAPYRKLLILGIGANDTQRRNFEDRLGGRLADHGVSAVSSYGPLPFQERLTEPQIRKAVVDGDFDGVILTRLIGVDEKTTVVPPRTDVMPSAGFGYGYGAYYGMSWSVVHSPGYTVTHRVVHLETRLYDADSGELVWSALSETFDPDEPGDTIESATAAFVKRLAEDGLIP
jgi:hypothetical protein